ncbi:MAG: hypothetical protein NXI20_02030 [bacterium]|nr:hypothetical protein [bacterium]
MRPLIAPFAILVILVSCSRIPADRLAGTWRPLYSNKGSDTVSVSDQFSGGSFVKVYTLNTDSGYYNHIYSNDSLVNITGGVYWEIGMASDTVGAMVSYSQSQLYVESGMAEKLSAKNRFRLDKGKYIFKDNGIEIPIKYSFKGPDKLKIGIQKFVRHNPELKSPDAGNNILKGNWQIAYDRAHYPDDTVVLEESFAVVGEVSKSFIIATDTGLVDYFYSRDSLMFSRESELEQFVLIAFSSDSSGIMSLYETNEHYPSGSTNERDHYFQRFMIDNDSLMVNYLGEWYGRKLEVIDSGRIVVGDWQLTRLR